MPKLVAVHPPELLRGAGEPLTIGAASAIFGGTNSGLRRKPR